MKKRTIIPIGLAFLPWVAQGSVQVRSLNVVARPAALVIGLDHRSGYRVSRRANPERVVIDLPGARLGAPLPPGSGVIRAVQAQQRPDGQLRLTLVLNTASGACAIWGSGARLVVSLTAVRARACGSAGRGGAAAAGVPAGGAPDGAADDGAAARDGAPHVVHAAHAPADTGRPIVIAVDAGHGGQDPGASGHSGTQEKDVVLAIARALAQRIDQQDGMQAVLTRDRDEFLTLRERMHRARTARSDLFVSVHADSIRDRAVSGSSVYVLSERGASNEAARWLAARENAADLMGGVSLSDKDGQLASVLLDLSQSAAISASMTAAKRVLGALQDVGAVRKASVQQAGFVVLKSPDIPSMLIETAYISNPADERQLRTPQHQRELAEAIFSGLHAYFVRNPPPGTHLAREQAGGAGTVLAAAGAPGVDSAH